ncbi:MAG TPA: hypothetical protein VII16_16940 [Actinomycetes bacterium]|jgi:hypothetical protein
MRKPTRRVAVLAASAAGSVAALGLGGVAYAAAGDDPATPEQGYVVVENGPGTGHTSGSSEDCPEKNQQGGGESQTPSQTDLEEQA